MLLLFFSLFVHAILPRIVEFSSRRLRSLSAILLAGGGRLRIVLDVDEEFCRRHVRSPFSYEEKKKKRHFQAPHRVSER